MLDENQASCGSLMQYISIRRLSGEILAWGGKQNNAEPANVEVSSLWWSLALLQTEQTQRNLS